jgi:hypothetical protein
MKKVKQKVAYLKEYISVIGKPKVLFIWIPKNAGTSFYEAFKGSVNMKMFLKVNQIKKKFTNKGSATFGHINVVELLNQNIIDKAYYDESYAFCISRNPYDRFVSLFHYLKKQDRIPSDYKPIDLITETMKGIPPVGLYNFKGISQCNRQVDWIEGLNIKKVLRFENLNDDAIKLSNELGFKLDIPHVNQSVNRKNFYEEIDAKTIELIQEYYKEDFIRFNYSMEIEL